MAATATTAQQVLLATGDQGPVRRSARIAFEDDEAPGGEPPVVWHAGGRCQDVFKLLTVRSGIVDRDLVGRTAKRQEFADIAGRACGEHRLADGRGGRKHLGHAR